MCMRLPSGQRRSCANSSSSCHPKQPRGLVAPRATGTKALISFFCSFAGGCGAAAKLSPALGFSHGHVDFRTLPPQLFPTRVALPTRGLQPCLAEYAKCTTPSVEALVTFAKRCGAFTASAIAATQHRQSSCSAWRTSGQLSCQAHFPKLGGSREPSKEGSRSPQRSPPRFARAGEPEQWLAEAVELALAAKGGGKNRQLAGKGFYTLPRVYWEGQAQPSPKRDLHGFWREAAPFGIAASQEPACGPDWERSSAR